MWDNLTNLAKKGIDIASDVSNTIAPLLAEENPWNEDEIDPGAGLRNKEEENRGENAEQEEDSEIPPYDITGSNRVSVELSSQLEGKNIMLREELEEMETMFHTSTRELQRLLSERDSEVSKLRSELQLLEAEAPNSQLDDVRNEKEVVPAAVRCDDTPPRVDTEETAVEKMLRDEIASQQTANMFLQSDLERQAADFRAQFESMQREIAIQEQNHVNLTGELTSLRNELQVHAKSLLEAQKQAKISESEVSSLNLALDEARDELRTKESIALSQESELVEARAKFAEKELLWKEERERYSVSLELQQQSLASVQDEVRRKLRSSLNTEHSELLPVRSAIEGGGADEVSCFETMTAADAELSQSSAAETETKLEEMSLKFESQSPEVDRLKAQIQQYVCEIAEEKQACSMLTNDVEQLQASSDQYHEELKGKSHKLDVFTKEMERMRETALQTQIMLEGKYATMEDQSAELLRMEHSIVQLREELGDKSSTILALAKELELLRQKAKEGLDDDHQSALSDEDLKGGTERISMDNKMDEGSSIQSHAEEEREIIMKLEVELKEALEKLELNEGLLTKQIQDSEELTFQMSEALAETQTKLDMTERELEPLTRERIEAKSSAKQLLESVERLIPSAVSEGEEQLSIPTVHQLALEAIQKLWEASELIARRLADALSSVGIECKLSEPLDVISALEEAVAAGAFSLSREAEDNNSKLRGQIYNLEKEMVALGEEVSAKDKTCGQLKVIIDQLRSAHRSGTEASSVLSAERDQLAATVKQTREELEYRQRIIKDLESRLTEASSKAESTRELQNKVMMLQKSEAEARAAFEAEEIAVLEDLEKERFARQEALHEAQESGQSAAEAMADLALARADTGRAQEAVVNMQRAFELFHEERSAEVNVLNEQFWKQKKESELALSVCEKALNEARESEKAAMNALNVVTERERVMAIKLKSVQEEAESKATALSNTAYSSFNADELVDKQLAANLVVKYISSHHDKRVLELVARVLSFTHNDLEAVGLERSGPGLMSEIMNTLVGHGENEEERLAPLTDLIEKGGTLGDAWVNFLLAEQPNAAEQQNDTEEEAAAAVPAGHPKESQQPAEE